MQLAAEMCKAVVAEEEEEEEDETDEGDQTVEVAAAAVAVVLEDIITESTTGRSHDDSPVCSL